MSIASRLRELVTPDEGAAVWAELLPLKGPPDTDGRPPRPRWRLTLRDDGEASEATRFGWRGRVLMVTNRLRDPRTAGLVELTVEERAA